MDKGQISFDLILMLVLILILAQVLIGVSDDIIESQVVITIKSQERQIALDLERILNYNKIMDRGGSSSIDYKIPMIYAPGHSAPIGCDIAVGGNEITVTVDSSNYPELAEAIETTINTTDSIVRNFVCGEDMSLVNS